MNEFYPLKLSPLNMDDELLAAVRVELMKREKQQQASEFKNWCAWLDETPPDMKLILNTGLVADLELQPHRWLSAGIDLLKSQCVTGHVQLMDGVQGPPLGGFLPYPVFQMGTEIFLKGMWLCQFEECRKVAHTDFVEQTTRSNYSRHLRGLGHDLLKIIAEIRKINEYANNPASLRFLTRVEAVIRRHYFPLYASDARASEWPHSRYPKRFYNDTTKVGNADAYQSYPQQRLVIEMFEPMTRHIDRLWSLRTGLLRQRKIAKSPNP